MARKQGKGMRLAFSKRRKRQRLSPSKACGINRRASGNQLGNSM